jgi:glycerate kinase
MPDETTEQGLTAWFSILDRPMSLDEAMRQTAPMLERASANVLRLCR